MVVSKEQEIAIEQLYEEMLHPLLAYAQSTLNDRALAEEAVQDTFRIACAKVNDLLSSENPKGWLTKTLKNVINNINRTRARLNSLIIASFAFEERAMEAQLDEENLDVLYADLVDNEDYILLKRFVLTRCTILEMSEELGISLEACKKRIQRARQRLQEIIKKNM